MDKIYECQDEMMRKVLSWKKRKKNERDFLAKPENPAVLSCF
jgi:hypothetical protein